MSYGLTYRREILQNLFEQVRLHKTQTNYKEWPDVSYAVDDTKEKEISYQRYIRYSNESGKVSKARDSVLTVLPRNLLTICMGYNEKEKHIEITVLEKDGKPMYTSLKLDRISKDLSLLHARQKLQSIIERSDTITREGRECVTQGQKQSWWSKRKKLDEELQNLLTSLERYWIGGFKVFLFYIPFIDIVHRACSININLIKLPMKSLLILKHLEGGKFSQYALQTNLFDCYWLLRTMTNFFKTSDKC